MTSKIKRASEPTQAESVYDVANWRPLPPPEFIASLGEAGCTAGEPNELRVTVEQLTDCRIRTVIWAEIKPRPFDGVSDRGPYLMTLYCPETGKSVCLIRTDVDLAMN